MVLSNKESTHSNVDAPDLRLIYLSLLIGAYPVCRQDRLYFLRLFLLSRKASNATTNIPAAIIKEATAKIIETISYAFIGIPSLLMYSGNPVKAWEVTTLSWILSETDCNIACTLFQSIYLYITILLCSHKIVTRHNGYLLQKEFHHF